LSVDYTQCWEIAEYEEHVVDDITKVTCEDCISCYEEGQKDELLKALKKTNNLETTKKSR